MKILVYTLITFISLIGCAWTFMVHKNFHPMQNDFLATQKNNQQDSEEQVKVKKTGVFSEKRLTPLLANEIFSPTRIVKTTGGTSNTLNMELIGTLSYGEKQYALISLPVAIENVGKKLSKTSSEMMSTEMEEQISKLPQHLQERIREQWESNPDARERMKAHFERMAQAQTGGDEERRGSMRGMRGGPPRGPQEQTTTNSSLSGKTKIVTRMVAVGELLDNDYELIEITATTASLQKGSQTITLTLDLEDKGTQTRVATMVKARSTKTTSKTQQTQQNQANQQANRNWNQPRNNGGFGGDNFSGGPHNGRRIK